MDIAHMVVDALLGLKLLEFSPPVAFRLLLSASRRMEAGLVILGPVHMARMGWMVDEGLPKPAGGQ